MALAGSLLLPGRVAAEPAATATPVLDAARKAVARHTGAAKEARAARATREQGADPDLRSGSFFKTPAGIAVLAAFGAGVGYALYSASNDRIRSSGR